MEYKEVISTKEIIKRTIVLVGIFLMIFLICFGTNYYKKYSSWKKVFEITYIGTEENTQGKTNGRKYIIFNNTNNTYEITVVYIEVSDVHKTYKIPYETHISLQPHETEEMILLYSKIGEFFGKDSYSCSPVIKGFQYEKR